jgi:hypothetical protein
MFKDPRLEPSTGGNMSSITNVVKEAKATVVGMIKDPLARNVEVQAGNQHGNVPRPGGYQGAGGGGGGYQGASVSLEKWIFPKSLIFFLSHHSICFP